MILGGSKGHLPAIEQAQRLGLKALVVDRDRDCVGARFADFFERVDTTDAIEVEQVARAYGIVGSMTLSSDLAVPTCCEVNEKLDLPMQGRGISRVVADKQQMKTAFAEGGVCSPHFYTIRNAEELADVQAIVERDIADTGFIVKPADSSGSRGVSKLTDARDLEPCVDLAREFSRNGTVIVEEFVEGMKFGVETFSMDGKMVLCLPHNSTSGPNMISVGHSFPIMVPDLQVEMIRNECARALESLGIVNGPANFDLILDHVGRPWVIEINARLGGVRLTELVRIHSGVDLRELTVRQASGESLPIPVASRNHPVAVRILHFEHEAVIRHVPSCQNLFSAYQVIEAGIDLQPPQQVQPLSLPIFQYGYVLCAGDSAEEAERNCERFLSEFTQLIEVEPSQVQSGCRGD
jgi:biotin carboxylase